MYHPNNSQIKVIPTTILSFHPLVILHFIIISQQDSIMML